MSIHDLIEAAEFLDRIERQREKYALLAETFFKTPSTYSPTLKDIEAEDLTPPSKKRRISFSESSATKQQHYKQNINSQTFIRPSHNELEKNRRANMRTCLEKLKEIVPLCPDANRHTTLSLLTKAATYIKSLEDEERQLANEKNVLLAHEKFLQRRMQLLTGRMTGYFGTNLDNVSSIPASRCESSLNPNLPDSNLNRRSASTTGTQLPTETKFIDAPSTSENVSMTNETGNALMNVVADNEETYFSCDKPQDNFTYFDNFQTQYNPFYSYCNYFNNSKPTNVDNFIHDKQQHVDGTLNQVRFSDCGDGNGLSWLNQFQPNLLYFNQCVYQSLINKHFTPLDLTEPSPNSMVKLLSPLNCSP